jgi:L-seryl-tRNA(Ser) seleniumtransferase
MELKQEELKKLPGVDKLLVLPEIRELSERHNVRIVKYAIRTSLDHFRQKALTSQIIPTLEEINECIRWQVTRLTSKSLKRVINATGIVMHTNLGRAPFGEELIRDASEVLKGYNNLEFDLEKGERGSRNTHVSSLLKYLTGAEDILLVNNNAAALMLVLKTFANRKPVIVSRGELIEIGGSFRLPDIMKASGCKMVEVGTTNKTSIRDYEQAVTPDTRLLLKAHKSNFAVHGFTQEASLHELVALGRQHSIPVVYDMGSGLLRKTGFEILDNEPDVRETLSTGVDLVTFSGDKLVGGDQVGIIAGKKELIAGLKREPLMRALRVGKTTLAFLEAALFYYLDDAVLSKKSLVFRMLSLTPAMLEKNALLVQSRLTAAGIGSAVISSKGQCGGGALPDKTMNSFAIRINPDSETRTKRAEFAEKMYYGLMKHQTPVVGILRKGEILFDMLTVPEEDYNQIVEAIVIVYHQITGK